jgi:putative addiction module CopG family antidote
MKIHLRPELEEMIKQDIQRGPYQSVDEFVERAISLLHDQEAWLAEHGSEIRAKVEKGYAAAQRGELIDSDQVRPTLDERKRSWQAENRQSMSRSQLTPQHPPLTFRDEHHAIVLATAQNLQTPW